MTRVRSPSPPPWIIRRERSLRAARHAQSLKLLILHWDKYPTARAVYREVLPSRGHRVVWLERGERGLEDFRLRTSGNLLSVDCPNPTPIKRGPLVVRGMKNRLRPLWEWGRKWLWTWRRAREFEPDFIQARDRVGDALIAWSVAALMGSRFAYQIDFLHFERHLNRTDGQSGLQVSRKRLRWRFLILERDFLLRRACLGFVISDEMRDYFLARGMRPERCHVFPVGVSADFGRTETEREQVRRRLGIAQEPVVAYVGSLDPSRNTQRIREILQGLASEEPSVRLMILGKGVASVSELMKAWGLEENVVFAGSVAHEEVADMLAASDVGIFPIDVDVPRSVYRVSSPLKVVEYMAAGAATLSSPVPEVVQLLRDSNGGIVVEDNLVDAFVRAGVALCRDRDRARRMGRQAREYVLQYKEFGVLGRMVESVYVDHRGPHRGAARE